MADLWLIPREGAPFGLTQGRIVVGREASADLVIVDASVSRRHAVLERTEAGWMISDQGSANGTWLDGQRISKAPFAAGQRVRFGAVTFSVSAQPAAAAPPAPAESSAAAPALAPPSAPAAAAPNAGSVLSPAQAAELLGVLPGAPADEVRRRYAKIFNDYNVRLTNAPTPALKRLYQRHIQELKTACEVLHPGLLADRK